jgi:hypothetical protein
MVEAFTVLLEVVITLTEELWLPPSTKREVPFGEMTRFSGAVTAIGEPTSASVLVSISTTWLFPVSAT